MLVDSRWCETALCNFLSCKTETLNPLNNLPLPPPIPSNHWSTLFLCHLTSSKWNPTVFIILVCFTKHRVLKVYPCLKMWHDRFSFLRLSNIPYATFCLSIRPWMNHFTLSFEFSFSSFSNNEQIAFKIFLEFWPWHNVTDGISAAPGHGFGSPMQHCGSKDLAWPQVQHRCSCGSDLIPGLQLHMPQGGQKNKQSSCLQRDYTLRSWGWWLPNIKTKTLWNSPIFFFFSWP